MRIAYFDAFSGASGDMILGALVGAGFPIAELAAAVAGLKQPGLTVDAETVRRGGLAGTKVNVRIEHPEHHPQRNLAEIQAVLDAADIAAPVRDLAGRVFERLIAAEARVHGLAPGEVHLHEAGALDALADVVGAAAGLTALAADLVRVSPLHVGSGTVRCPHGLLPVPAPATAELLAGAPTYSTGVEGELVTPTGAAILTTVAGEFGPWPAMVLERQGYGAGERQIAGLPNLLRLAVGTAAGERQPAWEAVDLLSATIDDMNPEMYGPLAEALAAGGALDSWLVPIQMKKGRPGTLVQALSPPERASDLADILLAHSTTLGVRVSSERRLCLPREMRAVETPYGTVRVKVARLPDGSERPAPEFEDCRRLAQKAGVPVLTVYQAALAHA